MNNYRLSALALLLVSIFLGYFVYASETPGKFIWDRPFRLGLDLSGGTHLVYKADISGIPFGEVGEAMSALKEVIEKRINVFGVSEPIIQVEQSGLGDKANHKLIVELPGVTDIEQALAMISKTPVLEFKVESVAGAPLNLSLSPADIQAGKIPTISAEALAGARYSDSGLTGKYLKRAQVIFPQGQGGGAALGPVVLVEFDKKGTELFAKITKENVGKTVGIFLDGELISAPVVQEEISGGGAQITGNFTVEEAKELVRNLNLGALPVPIQLDSTQTIGPTLGADVLKAGVQAGVIGFILLALFMIGWYRLPGVVAVVALTMYVVIILAIFKLLPVTITAAGIAGLILSIGIAVDANVLIFERLKEEMARGHSIHEATKEGFARAWLSIRDSNLSGIISATILFWLGTSMIKGFALTLIIGILVSMFSAITVTRTFLFALGVKHKNKVSTFLFSNGLHK
ncbi:MAG: protein-export membrane protein SecD [Candidatus Vogelbacteria bacterium RIFOXYD1_FULL_44_32]|uniref:Protein translocase subunit SecD n=1 Tax=Candidatus Vogelbacteria bacterium RIFOXYD1_FULL_44_32 TaxID=1802438 RepID=A0A1G2QF24_9BACT|nr:MAG: protein-export membrane protein SecD [Candidatus Vogelbacteria bacterium RIFOXYD1_FULL_44_32]